MSLWFLLALMTAAAVFAVLWPLGRRTKEAAGSDAAVYRDQLGELERDRKAGLIGDREAEAARVEIGRRLLAAVDAGGELASSGSGTGLRRRGTALAALTVVPVVAIGIYLAIGSPGQPGMPLEARNSEPLQDRSLASLVAQVEAHLAANPEDARGWEVLAPVYIRLGRFEDAVKARRAALRLGGATATREADLGEALVYAANGVVTGEARSAFERALELDAGEIRARYFVGLAAEQDGRPEEAAKLWRALLADAAPDAGWTDLVRAALARVEPGAPKPGAPKPGAPLPAAGPSEADVAAAEQLSPEERGVMVRGMVERLAARLKEDASDVEGWGQLVRAYLVLGEGERAKEAAADARRALAADADKLRRINEVLDSLGLET